MAQDKSAPNALVQLDETGFRCTVEPILIRDCSYTACHGNGGFALRVYSVGKLREVPPANTDERIAPLTDSERHANFLSAAGFTYGHVKSADNWLLRKPLPPDDGGYEHVGGAIFTGKDDGRVQTIQHWLDGNPDACPAPTP